MSTTLLKVALTGGIATGKTYCLTRFAELGVPTIDADVLAHRALAPGTPGREAAVARFGRGILQANGEIDRQRLGQIVFADDAARRDLEGIIHPVVYTAIERWFAGLNQPTSCQTPERTTIAIADIPLLYETGHDRSFDRVIVTACPTDRQVARLVARNQLSEADARRRLASQWPLEEKIRRADYVIDTSGAFADTDRQVRRVWEELVIGDR